MNAFRPRTAVPGAHPRPGITIVEVLVCIGILSLLAALALPAVERVRESSRSVTCRNNLRQIGLAVQNYQSTFRVFPIGCLGVVDLPGGGRRIDQYSGISRCLPQLDQEQVYRRIDFSKNAFLPGDEGARELLKMCDQITIPVTLCPSDGEAVGGRCSYSVNVGVVPGLSPPVNLVGAFGWPWVGPADFRDGLSNTAGLSETLIGAGDSFSPVRHLALIPESELGHMPKPRLEPGPWVTQCASISREPEQWFPYQGRSWVVCTGNIYNHLVVPQSEIVGCAVAGHYPPWGVNPARSGHFDVVHTVMMDGAVKRIHRTIDTRAWFAIGTRAGSDVVPEL